MNNDGRLTCTWLSRLQVCGIQTPPVNPPQPEEGSDAPPPQTFGQEAKHFADLTILQREVRLVLQGVDKYDNLFASVVYPGPTDPEPQFLDWGLQLVDRGLARVRLLSFPRLLKY